MRPQPHAAPTRSSRSFDMVSPIYRQVYRTYCRLYADRFGRGFRPFYEGAYIVQLVRFSIHIYLGAMLYRNVVSELLTLNPERWNSKLAKPYDMRVVFTWLYVCMTTDSDVTLRQTKYKLNAMGRLQGYRDLNASVAVDLPPTSTLLPYRPPAAASSHYEEFRLRYIVDKGSNQRPSLRPIGDPTPSGMLPPSTYSVCVVGEEIAGAHIYVQSPWTFTSDCKVVIDGGTTLSFSPLFVEATSVGDGLTRMTMCVLPSDLLVGVGTCSQREASLSTLQQEMYLISGRGVGETILHSRPTIHLPKCCIGGSLS